MLIIDKPLIHIYMFECHLYLDCIWHRNLMAISTLNICISKHVDQEAILTHYPTVLYLPWGTMVHHSETSIGYAFAINQASELVLKVNAPHQKKDKPFIL